MSPGGGRPAHDRAPAAHVLLLKDVVRSTLALEAEEAVLIQQLACAEPDCPPVETVIAVLGTPRRTWKFAMTTVTVNPALLRETLVNHPRGRDHDDHH
ncbi:hypothetical protein JRC04_25440 [Mycolicibacterium sp. S2-37]|uniref:hypothetical protein n=1 Tax=Mycolicibacterium sp. S2-37 TaxID=2810297 RepID=UPI001A94E1AE|nr:hypothetical protein [Mycolicibacterium sp. S2-37]MBO0680824.1 hypothetical protein [Mycolicibacterium sp. S2-37]